MEKKSTYQTLISEQIIHSHISAGLTLSFEELNDCNMGNANSWLMPDWKKTQAHPYGLSVFRADPEEEAKFDFESTLRSVRRFLECRNRDTRETDSYIAGNYTAKYELYQNYEFYLAIILVVMLVFAALIVIVDCLGTELRKCRNRRRGYEPMLSRRYSAV